jgi:hypothetical protein
MKVFLCWSGEQSRAVASALNDWLPLVIQSVNPMFSPEIEKGVKWASELDTALQGTTFGIVCLTKWNLGNSWIHFESGALSKASDLSRIWTLLFQISPSDVHPPLSKFQHTEATKSDIRRLVGSINKQNRISGQPMDETRLDLVFETFWPDLEQKLSNAKEILDSTGARSDAIPDVQTKSNAVLEEILGTVRDQYRNDMEYRNINESRWQEFSAILSALRSSGKLPEQNAFQSDGYTALKIRIKDDLVANNSGLDDEEFQNHQNEALMKIEEAIYDGLGKEFNMPDQIYTNKSEFLDVYFFSPISEAEAKSIRAELKQNCREYVVSLRFAREQQY